MALDLDDLEHLVRGKGLRLETSRGLQATAHLDGNPDALVDELLRLARIGAEAEKAQLNGDPATVGELINRANRQRARAAARRAGVS